MTDEIEIARIATALDRVATKVVQIVTLDAVANLSSRPPTGTPIDTGWARNNWIPAIGTRNTRGAGGRFQGAGAVGDPDNPQVARAAQEAGIAQILTQYTLDKGKVTITNAVPYINLLNMGRSKQSPAGFVQAAILKAVQGVQKLDGDQISVS